MTDSGAIVYLTVLVVAATVAQAAFTWWTGVIQRNAAAEQSLARTRERLAHQAEARGAQLERETATFHLIRAEALRLSSLKSTWENGDVIELIEANVISAQELALRDPRALVELCATFGNGAALLGSTATIQCYTTIAKVARMQRLYNDAHNDASTGNTSAIRYAAIHQRYASQFEAELAVILSELEQASLMLNDAAACWDQAERVVSEKLEFPVTARRSTVAAVIGGLRDKET